MGPKPIHLMEAPDFENHPQVWKMGTTKPPELTGERAFWFSQNDEVVDFYRTRGDGLGYKTVAFVDVRKPASFEDVEKAAEAICLSQQDLDEHSPNGDRLGEDPTQYLYVPRLRTYLQQQGFDGYRGTDVFCNYEHDMLVAFDGNQIHTQDFYRSLFATKKGIHPQNITEDVMQD